MGAITISPQLQYNYKIAERYNFIYLQLIDWHTDTIADDFLVVNATHLPKVNRYGFVQLFKPDLHQTLDSFLVVKL